MKLDKEPSFFDYLWNSARAVIQISGITFGIGLVVGYQVGYRRGALAHK